MEFHGYTLLHVSKYSAKYIFLPAVYLTRVEESYLRANW